MKTHKIDLRAVVAAVKYGAANVQRRKCLVEASRLMNGNDMQRRLADLVQLVADAANAGAQCGIFSLQQNALSKEA